eukprot:1534-Heterococcus_DN1.PRE.4
MLRSTAHCAREACVAQNPKSMIWPQCFLKLFERCNSTASLLNTMLYAGAPYLAVPAEPPPCVKVLLNCRGPYPLRTGHYEPFGMHSDTLRRCRQQTKLTVLPLHAE